MTPKEAAEKSFNENRRIFELEDIIAEEDSVAVYYAVKVIKGRFEKGENIISMNPWWSFHYARDVIKGPFQRSHYVIGFSRYRYDYLDFLLSIHCDLTKLEGCEWLI
jgi:hypothetical protein